MPLESALAGSGVEAGCGRPGFGGGGKGFEDLERCFEAYHGWLGLLLLFLLLFFVVLVVLGGCRCC